MIISVLHTWRGGGGGSGSGNFEAPFGSQNVAVGYYVMPGPRTPPISIYVCILKGDGFASEYFFYSRNAASV